MNRDEKFENMKSLLSESNFSEEQKKEMLSMLSKQETERALNKIQEQKNMPTPSSNEDIHNTQNINKLIIENYNIDTFKISCEIPCDMDLFKIYFIAYKNRILNKNSNMLGAFILKWMNEDLVTYSLNKGALFKKSEYVIKLKSNVDFDNEYEKEIYSFIKRAAEDKELTFKEFKTFTEKRHIELQNLIDEIFEIEENKLIETGEVTKSTSTKTHLKNNSFNTEHAIKVNTIETKIKYSDKLLEDINDIIGFKNYIKSLHNNSNINLTKEQLIICELLGITNYIQGYFSTIYPEFYFRYYQYLYEIRISYPKPESGLERIINMGKLQMK